MKQRIDLNKKRTNITLNLKIKDITQPKNSINKKRTGKYIKKTSGFYRNSPINNDMGAEQEENVNNASFSDNNINNGEDNQEESKPKKNSSEQSHDILNRVGNKMKNRMNSFGKRSSSKGANSNSPKNTAEVANAAKTVGNQAAKSAAVKTVGKTAAKFAAAGVAKKAIASALAAIAPYIGGIFVFILILALLIALIMIIFGGAYNGNNMAFGGYYEPECSEMTVISKDGTSANTYSLTDYVAGVVAAEVGGANNIEVYKTFAVAARTYGLRKQNNCSIENSTAYQVFKDITNDTSSSSQMIYEAVKETEGIVLLNEGGTLFAGEYDAFCYVDKDSNYFTLSQQNQKIPTSWVETNVGSYYYKNCPCNLNDSSMPECFADGVWQDGGHGRGMSQLGSYYLAKEQGYTYDQILNFYYGDSGAVISRKAFISSIAGLEIKTTTDASNTINEPISNLLSSNGASLEDYNKFIKDSVEEIGPGTREAVVTAAVSSINFLYDNFNAKLPYYWSGYSNTIGIPATFGTYHQSPASNSGSVNYYRSFDCSGFVSWSIMNGGFNFSRYTTKSLDDKFAGDSCSIKDSSCKGQPGDLINSRSCHVQMIVAVDEASGKYYIAESTGSLGVIMRQWDMHSGNCGNAETKILHLDNFYNNSANVNTNY